MRLESSLMERKKISSPGIGRLLRVLSARQPVSRRQAPAKLSSHARSKASNRGRARRYYPWDRRSEEHTSELQSRLHLVCRLLLEKKNERLGFLLFLLT